MKELTLIRHAKSSWDYPELSDHDRPLDERGEHDAPMMGRRLRERGFSPDVILASTAVRAQRTAELIAAELGYDPADIVSVSRLYASSPATMVAVVGELDDTLESAVVVAHDPGMSDLASRLSPDIDRMPTCAVAQFTFAVDSWKDLPGAHPTSAHFDTPKN